MSLDLSDNDAAMISGDRGEALAMAMRILTKYAEIMGASELLDISAAHIDGCLVTGQSSLDLAEAFRDRGGQVAVPTTLNVSSLDLLHPELYRGDDEPRARQLMQAYEDMGCQPTWTCAPYQLRARPGFGDQIAWAESNAIAFANSVLGARTNRYGDFIDICCALTGRAPAAGLHLDEHRLAQLVISVEHLPARLLATDAFFPVLGFIIGTSVGTLVPAVMGIPHATEDQLKAMCAAAASSGSVGLIHVVGITPEAPELSTALGSEPALDTITVTPADVVRARDRLSSGDATTLSTISLGTPHYSQAELATLLTMLAGRSVHESIAMYVNTSRDVLGASEEIATGLSDLGVQLVTDTCTYITPVMKPVTGMAMTDSAKWAYYAPGNLGVDVAFASLPECVESAVSGRIVRDPDMWGGL